MNELRLRFGEHDVSALYRAAESPSAVLVFAHGAGASMRHASMQGIVDAVYECGISTLRFNFPYMEAGKNRVDSKVVSVEAICAACSLAKSLTNVPLLVGGHSFGGRMASHAVVDSDLQPAGLIFCSFPLHNPKKPSLDRAEHMDAIECPMLFLSGSRDGMAQPELMDQLIERLGAEIHWLDTADHGYKVLKRSRQREDDVFTEIASYANTFVQRVLT